MLGKVLQKCLDTFSLTMTNEVQIVIFFKYSYILAKTDFIAYSSATLCESSL